MARARIYIRRSDDDQSAWSPEAQERESRRWCAERGHEVIGAPYTDDDLSGRREDRPALQRLLADAKADAGSIVVVHKFDRLARDTEATLRIVYKELLPKRVTIFSVSEAIDPYTPLGKMMLTLSGGVSTYHVDNLRLEVLKGLNERFQQGRWIGLLPYGYRTERQYHANGERIKGTDRAVFSDDAPIVREIFTRYATDSISDTQLAEELNARGLSMVHKGRRVPFQKDAIRGILGNRFYLGFVTYQGQERLGNHEPLIDADLWNQVQAVRQRRTHQRTNNQRAGGGRLAPAESSGLLLKIGYCGRCGAVLHWHNGEDYWCSRRRKFGKSACDAPMVLAAHVDPLALAVVRALFIPPTLRDAVLTEVRCRLDHAPTNEGRQRSALEAQLARLKDLYQMGHLVRAEYLEKRTQIELQLDRLPMASARMLNVERAVSLLSDLPALLDTAPPIKRRSIVRQILDRVWIEKAAVVAIKPTATFVLLVELAAQGSLAISAGLEPTTFSSGG